MKKIISAVAMFASIAAFSQIQFGVRANLLFNTSSAKWKDIKSSATNAWESGGKNNTGFNAGFSAKIDLPVTSIFIMPEIYYTSIKNTVEVMDSGRSVEIEAKNDKIDVPVLIGKDFLAKTVSAFIGPVFSYNLAKENTFQDLKENGTKDFTVGYQIGANVNIKKLVLNARYEGAFSKDERKFINTFGEGINYDNRPSFFVVGLGYNF